MTESESYPTDRFGRADGRNYHYRIPLNDTQAMKRAALALDGMHPYKGRRVHKWDGHSGDGLSYMGIKTHDSKGHLDGLAKFAHSDQWQDLGPMSDINEYRHANGGGSKVRGSFRCSLEPHQEITLQFSTVVDLTPAELQSAYENHDENWKEVLRITGYAKQEALDEYQEKRAELQRDCSHDRVVESESARLDNPNAVGYCEDCQGEVDESGELAY